MTKKSVFCVFMALAVTFSSFADKIQVTGTAPKFKAKDPSAAGAIDEFNNSLESVFNDMLGSIGEMVTETIPEGFINSNNLLRGFGNSSIYSSHGATMRAFGGYKTFTVSLGTMVGIQLPANAADLASGKISPENFMADDKLTFGVNPQFFSINAGFHPSSVFQIMPKDLYLGLRLGFLNIKNLPIPDMESAHFNTFTIGVTANYQILPKTSLAKLITWRGLSLGSGLLIQTTKFGLPYPIDRQEQAITNTGPMAGSNLVIDSKVIIDMNITTVTIPIEAITAINIVGLNIPLGLGFDVGFGSTDLKFGVESAINVTGNNHLIEQQKEGKIFVGIKNKIAPQFFNMKLMTGVGFSIADVFVIDFPFTFYFADNGFNLGVTIGVTF
jgi:hypothetical protein